MTETKHTSATPPQHSKLRLTPPRPPESSFAGRRLADDAALEAPENRSRAWSAVLANKRRLLLVSLLIVLIGSCAGLGSALLWPRTYAARAQVLFEISEEKPTGFLRQDRSLTTQLVLLRSRQVLAPVAAQERIPVEEMEKQVTVSLLDSSEVIQVEARAGARDVAQRRAQEIVDRYLQVSTPNSSSEVEGYVHSQLTEVQGQLAQARAHLEGERATSAPGSSALAVAESQVQSLSQREQQLRSQADQLSVAELSRSAPKVVVPPYGVPDAVSPRPLFALAAGVLAGVLVAAVTAAVLVRRWSMR